MDTAPMIAMAFGLLTIWSGMIAAMVAVWNARDQF